ncbi:hypothetical protein [Rugosimonospora africana]|uniref:Uncharacterized protein n=1 Tax=Rugosimonospora africana TaxID=556532 RepID=A0A8J3VQ83_9ACTN|nr:hypothetical protein [Rugosimonospora africana]GIH14874.1 hypothetical protein Raf01_30460 [Rugosimonospora africana]
MSPDMEEQLTAGMREAVHGLTLTRDVLADAGRRHQRRIVAHRTAYAAGVVGLVGALAAATVGIRGATGTTGSTPPDRGHGQPVAVGPDSPRLRLDAAIKASTETSYQVKITSVDPSVPAWTTTGAFDPATTAGYLESPRTGLRPWYVAGYEHERLLDGVLYIGFTDSLTGKVSWARYEGGRPKNLDYDDALGGALAGSADSNDLFQVLRQTGATVTQTSANVYHFEVSVKNPDAAVGIEPGLISDAFAGDVTLGADKRIATVAYRRTTTGTPLRGSEPHTDHLRVTIELSGYGAPVRVEKPTVTMPPVTVR